jgi:hypothetical protein
VDGVGDRDQMLIKLARRDRVEQPTLGTLQMLLSTGYFTDLAPQVED